MCGGLLLLVMTMSTTTFTEAQVDTGLFSQPLDCYMCFSRYWDVLYDVPADSKWKEFSVEHGVSINECSYRCLANKTGCSGAMWLAEDETAVGGKSRSLGACTLYPEQKSVRILLKHTTPMTEKRHYALMAKKKDCKSISTDQKPEDENPLDKEIINCCNTYNGGGKESRCTRVNVAKKLPKLREIKLSDLRNTEEF